MIRGLTHQAEADVADLFALDGVAHGFGVVSIGEEGLFCTRRVPSERSGLLQHSSGYMYIYLLPTVPLLGLNGPKHGMRLTNPSG